MTTQPVDGHDLWAGLPDMDEPPAPVWEDPVPLAGPRKLTAFPIGSLPGWLREFVAAVAEETQTPVDLAGCIALSVLATAAGGRSVVQVRGHWREPTNLYVVVSLPPANRKSAVFGLLTDPLYEAEQQLRTLVQPAIVEAEMTARLAKEAADKATAKAASAGTDERDQLVATAIALAQTADSVSVPAKPQLLADDTTAETVTSRMAEQGGRIAVMSAEGDIFDIIAGRYSGKPNMGVFLKGHAGDRLKVDRQTREEYIEHPALTMGLCVQPQVLDDIGRQDGFKGRGLLGRFLYSVPESLVGRRKIEPDPIPEQVMETYRRHVLDLTLFLAEWTDPAVIQLTPEAVAAITAFRAGWNRCWKRAAASWARLATGAASWSAPPPAWPPCYTSPNTSPKGTWCPWRKRPCATRSHWPSTSSATASPRSTPWAPTASPNGPAPSWKPCAPTGGVRSASAT